MLYCSLKDLDKNESAVIKKIANNKIRQRLMDMGIIPGEEIKIKSIAVWGDPIEISVRNYNLALRKSEAENIFVIKKDGAS